MTGPTRLTDPDTGREYWQLTSGASNDQTLYFHNNAWLPDGGRFVFRSDRSGAWRLHLMNAETGAVSDLDFPLTNAGFGSGIVGVDGGLYYKCGRELRRYDFASGADTCLYSLHRPGRLKSFTLAHDASAIVFAVYDSSQLAEMEFGAFEEWKEKVFNVPDEVWDHNAYFYLLPLETREPELLLHGRHIPSHIQFSPASSRDVCYCHEGAQIGGRQRLWMLDTQTGDHRLLRPQRPDELVTHEWWSHDGAHVLYHLVEGYYRDGAPDLCYEQRAHFIGRMPISAGEEERFAASFGSQHYNRHPAGTCVFAEGDRHEHDFIYSVALTDGKAEHTPLVRHGSRATGFRHGGAEVNLQCNPQGTLAFFNSDREGAYNVYVLTL